MAFKTVWRGGTFQSMLTRRISKSLNKAGNIILADVVQSLSKQGRGLGLRGGDIHSPPGKPPYWQTQMLRRSIAKEVDQGTHGPEVRIGTNLFYAKFLEEGTKRSLKPRPFLKPALNRNIKRVTRLLKGLIK